MTFTNFRFSKILVTTAILLFQNFVNAQIIVPLAGCAPLENFDNSNPWTFGGTNSSWLWANPNKQDITDDITIGGKCLILGGNTNTSTYNQNEESWAESPSYNLAASDNPYLSFYFYWSNEGSTNYDEIWMEYSLNNGTSWTDLSTPVGTGTCYDQNWYNYPDNWGGNVGGCFPGLGGPSGWVLVRKCINDLANEPNVKFRFRLSTGTTCQNYGATIDNFKVCDASVTAQATYQCTQQPLEIEFFDESYDCPTNWFWLFGDGDSSDVVNPIHTYPSPGIYTVTLVVATNVSVTSGCGGPFQDAYTFDIEVIDASITNQTNVSCYGLSDATATANVLGAKPNATLNWTPTPPFGQGTNSISGLSTGTYDLLVVGENTSCTSTASVTITEPTEIMATYSSTNVSCPTSCDGTLAANVAGGQAPYIVTWNPGNIVGTAVNGVCPGNYDVSIVDDNGCTLSEPNVSHITAPPNPEVLNLKDTVVCAGAQVNLTNFQVSTGVTNVQWNIINNVDLGFGLTGSGNIPIFTANVPAIAIVQVIPEISANCVGLSDTFKIKVAPIPEPDFTFLATGNCEPLSVVFDVTNPINSSQYKWLLNGSVNRVGNPLVYKFNAGVHSVALTEISDDNCTATTTKTDIINVNAKPSADFNFSPDYYDEQGSEVEMTNQTITATDFVWSVIGTDFISANKDVTITLAEDGKGFYEILLVAVNNGGCRDSVNKFIKVREPEILYVPNAFTPFNGGDNAEFKPIVESGIDIYNYTLTIYNRWGEVVFVSQDPARGWNGTLDNGQQVSPGVYTYAIRYSSLYRSNPKSVMGYVILID